MSADKSVSAVLAASYKTDLLLVGCGVALTLGVTAGVLYPLPKNSKIKSSWLKGLFSVAGGLAAFVYMLSKGMLDEIGMLWIAGVAFVAPAAAEAVHAILVGAITGAVQGVVDRFGRGGS